MKDAVVSLLVIATTFAMVYIVYRCLKDHGLPSININNTGHGGASTAELTPLMPDSVIRRNTTIAREKPVQFTSEQLDRYTHRRSAELGSGGYGVVYKGMLPNGLEVAVKVLDESKGSEVTEQQFMAEVGTLWRTNHANLIGLIGFCFDDAMHALVYEFMAKRSLDNWCSLVLRVELAGYSCRDEPHDTNTTKQDTSEHDTSEHGYLIVSWRGGTPCRLLGHTTWSTLSRVVPARPRAGTANTEARCASAGPRKREANQLRCKDQGIHQERTK
jgi:hypothetical protein